MTSHQRNNDYHPVRTLDDAEQHDALYEQERDRMLKYETVQCTGMVMVAYGLFMLFTAGLALFICSLLYVIGANCCNYLVVAKIDSHSVLPENVNTIWDPICDFNATYTDQYSHQHTTLLRKKPCRFAYTDIDGVPVIDGCFNWQSPKKLHILSRGSDDGIFPKHDIDNLWTALMVLIPLFVSGVVSLVLSCLTGVYLERQRTALPV